MARSEPRGDFKLPARQTRGPRKAEVAGARGADGFAKGLAHQVTIDALHGVREVFSDRRNDLDGGPARQLTESESVESTNQPTVGNRCCEPAQAANNRSNRPTGGTAATTTTTAATATAPATGAPTPPNTNASCGANRVADDAS